jgi:hypothetical protein
MSYTPAFDRMLRPLFVQGCSGTGKRTVYVSGSGSDTNNGLTVAAPLRQINTALGLAQPGDLISVDNGTYAYVNPYGVDGTGTAWITVMAKAGANPQVNVNDSSGDDGLDIQQSSFLGVYGLEIFGNQQSSSTNPSGIGVFRGSHHIRLWANLIHDFPGGGINCFWVASSVYNGSTLPSGSWDLVDISFNTIHGCCKYSPDNTSGISFFGAIDQTGGATWDGRYGYMAVGNYIYDCECTVPYTPGGFNYVTDGNGMSFDSLYVVNNLDTGVVPYSKRGLAEGNLVVGCGGRGLHIFNTINVDDFFNTYVGNLGTTSPAITGGVEADASYSPAVSVANGVSHYGNVICPLNTPNSTDGVSSYASNVILGGTQAVPVGNFDERARGVSYFAVPPTLAQIANGLPISVFVPVTPDVVNRSNGSRGYQTVGAGGRSMLVGAGAMAQWTAGALEKTVPSII